MLLVKSVGMLDILADYCKVIGSVFTAFLPLNRLNLVVSRFNNRN